MLIDVDVVYKFEDYELHHEEQILHDEYIDLFKFHLQQCLSEVRNCNMLTSINVNYYPRNRYFEVVSATYYYDKIINSLKNDVLTKRYFTKK